ncbi:MAG: selenide, water dikinase SelD [Actinomycetota bacterium]
MRHFGEHHRSEDPNLLLGLDAPDDAAVYRVSEGQALLLTVDFFTPIVDDPYQWGAIAAANAFSDCYAMGGKPVLALNLVGWPQSLDFNVLAQVLEGGADKAAEAGVSVVGGHTIEDQEPKYGMSVTGMVHPDRLVRSSAARPGMSLVLTKPLSMGIVATAIKRQACPATLAAEATTIMATLNAGAAEAMLEVGVEAATDVTGFGLLGHLHSMMRLSGVSAELWAGSVPVLEGVADLAAAGLVPGGTRRNASYYSSFVDFPAEVGETDRTLLFDAQTSGGMLIVVDTAAETALLDGLRRRGTPVASVIGRTMAGEAGRIYVKAGR